jgi:iron(III) transport system permease protein
LISWVFKIVGAFFSVLAVMAIGIIVYQSFLGGPFYEKGLVFTISSYVSTFRDSDFYRAFTGSLVIGLLTLLALPIALFAAIAVHKIGIYGARVIEPILIIPMFISPIIWGFAWLYSYGPAGMFPSLWGDIYGLIPTGIISALVHVPNAYVILSTSILGIDSSYEEVARSHGARALLVIARVVLPMIRPSIVFSAILLFILGMEQFGIPLLLYSSVGGLVLTTYIYQQQVLSIAPNYPKEAVAASILIYTAISLLILQRYLAMRLSRRYAVIGSRVRSIGRIAVSPLWRGVATAAILVFVVFTIIIPLLSLIIRSLNPLYGGRGGYSLDYYVTILSSEYHRGIIMNTLEIAFIAASLGTLACIGFSLSIMRSGNVLESRLFDIASTLPRAMPGIVMGLAFLWLYLFTPLRPILYTPLGIALAHITAWSIMGTRVLASSIGQISPELEEVARVHGASVSITLRRVVLPLVKRAILISWLVMFIYSIRDYSIATLLVLPQTMIVGAFLIMSYGSGEIGIVTALSSLLVMIILAITTVIFKLGWKPYG